MMSVLIKNMEMPESCIKCRLDLRTDVCQAFVEWRKKHPYSVIWTTDRLPDCPLVELPKKHERLVEFIDVATTTDEDTGTETVNLGEAFAAYFKMRESKSVIEAEGE